MIVKSFEIQKKNFNFPDYNMFLFYGENIGLKKDIRDLIKASIRELENNLETINIYEHEIADNKDNLYNSIYSGSLFSNKKLITIYDATDKIYKDLNNIYEKYPKDTYIIIFANLLEKKSKLRNFFEKNKKGICVPCYLDSEKDLEIIAKKELNKNNIIMSRETLNLLIEKSNSDRNNLKNEINKIIAYAFNKKKIDFDEIKSLINFSGTYKTDKLINECLCGDIFQFKKTMSEFYINTTNEIFFLRILGNKINRLLNIKEKSNKNENLDNLINNIKPAIFWKEKPLIKKQLLIWNIDNLKKVFNEIYKIELMCKKNPNISKIIFFDFFSKICTKANSFS